ncbi:unnamed protein product [Auanema sp. JU1783]|nr:unnamed protein product [Auanema sp. JU1783]
MVDGAVGEDSTCSNLRTFLTKLEEMRKSDDMVIIALNNELPTKSFPGCEKSKAVCEDFLNRAKILKDSRQNLLDKCRLLNEKLVEVSTDMEKKSATVLIRQIKSQQEIEEVVWMRTRKAITERCSHFI